MATIQLAGGILATIAILAPVYAHQTNSSPQRAYRLKRPKDARLAPDYFDERLVMFEEQRARLNAYFCASIETGEEIDADRFAKRYDEYRKMLLDEVQVHRDVEIVKQYRQAAGKPPKVHFLTPDEQREWEGQPSKTPERDGEHP